MIFPLVILTVAALIYIAQIFYRQTEIRAEMHKALRAESGKICGTLSYREPPDQPFPIYQKGLKVCSYGTLAFKKKGILAAGEKVFFSEKYLDDERAFIRKADLIQKRKQINE